MISRSFERPDRTVSRASDATNRYKIRYTTNQHRPTSRQVNNHGRVSGTHRPTLPDKPTHKRLETNKPTLRESQGGSAAVFRTVFAQPDPDAVRDAWDEVAAQLGARFPKVAALMADAKPEVLAFRAFPRAHWQKIWSTNPLEHINEGEL